MYDNGYQKIPFRESDDDDLFLSLMITNQYLNSKRVGMLTVGSGVGEGVGSG